MGVRCRPVKLPTSQDDTIFNAEVFEMSTDQEVVLGRTADRSFLAAALRDFSVKEYQPTDSEVRMFFPDLASGREEVFATNRER